MYVCYDPVAWIIRFVACLFPITWINKVEVNWLNFLQVKYGKSCNISNVYRSVADPQICLQSIIRWHGSQISTFWTPDSFGTTRSVVSNGHYGKQTPKSICYQLNRPFTLIFLLCDWNVCTVSITDLLNGLISRFGSMEMKTSKPGKKTYVLFTNQHTHHQILNPI